ncbi:hypothetical protein L228DRAFT_66057 [Xylona heveae TC161]|uniref:Uncharacterized protein n=1 Tax=Xylona heveae (strain CBS 132557 / TC161) TaxID=1328760 RepID=A0A165IRW0_XYLHT|nr:hypothetical protein L228DRAFT_66057 [Xylona heveae TC161]KZF25295.1 hypothetical protein L228DRAFT_66057 [Xylona heveae TC161]
MGLLFPYSNMPPLPSSFFLLPCLTLSSMVLASFLLHFFPRPLTLLLPELFFFHLYWALIAFRFIPLLTLLRGMGYCLFFSLLFFFLFFSLFSVLFTLCSASYPDRCGRA